LTQLGGAVPFSTAKQFSTAIFAISFRVTIVPDAMCGTTVQFGIVTSG
jgi:hypothetical protein